MFVINDDINDHAMECDEEDTVALEHDLADVASGALSEADFEDKLKHLFAEATREDSSSMAWAF